MALGPGKYDDETTNVRIKTGARGIVVIVFDGTFGSGFSAQLPIDLLIQMPAILRQTADQIEESKETES